jgi:hypothetical protein
LIIGAILLPIGIALGASTLDDIHPDYGLFFGGIILGGGGLGILIPGIVLRTKYNKYVD